MINSTIIKSVLLLVGVVGIILTIDLVSEDSFLFPKSDIVDVIEDPVDDEDDLLQQQELERLRLLEEQRLAELQAEEDLYTLGNRDKPQDYLNLFDNSIKHTFIVDFDGLEWQGLIDDMEAYHDEFGTYRSNNYRKVDVTYYADDEEFIIPDVGIRSKGNVYSRYPPVDEEGNIRPIHYVLKFNETFDIIEDTLPYDLLKKREVFDLEKLIFKWNRNGDQTYLSEIYSMQVFKDIGVAAPNMSLTEFVIRVDGEEVQRELYSVQEDIDEEFIRKQLQEVPTKEVGDLYKVIWPGTLEPIYDTNLVGIREWETNTRPVYGLETNDDTPNYQQLIDFTIGLHSSNLTIRKNFIESRINVDNLIRMFAASIFLGNPDDYRGNANNYYFYFDEEGVATYIPYDFDHSLGQGWDGSPVFINHSLGNDIYIWEGNGFGSATRNIPLIDNILLEYDEYQIMYEDYLEQIITDEIFSYDSFSELFNTANSLYGSDYSMSNDKEYYITTKINNVLDDIEYYRNERDNN